MPIAHRRRYQRDHEEQKADQHEDVREVERDRVGSADEQRVRDSAVSGDPEMRLPSVPPAVTAATAATVREDSTATARHPTRSAAERTTHPADRS